MDARELLEALILKKHRGLTRPRRIPQHIHQTYSSASVPRKFRGWVASWKQLNPGWKHTLWADAECAAFVARHFPEYAAAFAALPKAVERADFFRYLVLLQQGVQSASTRPSAPLASA